MDGAKFVLVDPSQPIQRETAVIEWKLCVLCQKDDGSKLVVPSQNSCAEKFKGYSKLDNVIQMFNTAGLLGSLPFSINLSAINDGTGIFETLKTNNAVYHKNCLLQCSDREFQRAVKRKRKEKLESNSPVKTRRFSKEFDQNKCLFCDQIATRKLPLFTVTTVSISAKITKYSVLLKDTLLMAKVSGAHDLIALEASYHSNCLTAFNNRIRAYEKRIASKSQDGELPSDLSELHAYGLANLASHIDDVREATPIGLPIFKMTDLAKVYSNFMEDMGVDHVAHTSRLRDRLLAACPHLQASGTAGQEILITFRSDHDVSIRAAARDFDTDAFRFADVAKVLRSDIFCQEETRGWEKMLDKQTESTPLSLKTLLKMIMRGPGSIASITEEEADFDQVVNSLAQLISYHAVKRVSKSTTRRHTSEREKPVPVYLAMKIYGDTRSKTLVNMTHELGLSISYSRLQTILDEKAAAVSQRYSKSEVVCPPSLHTGDFTIGAVDNIDHNTSSYTAKTSFHGTAISLMQFPDVNAPGVPQVSLRLDPKPTGDNNIDLPDQYSIVKHCDLNVKSVRVPLAERCTVEITDEASPMQLGKVWLDTQNSTEFLPWPVFNSRAENVTSKCLTRTAVLPLFSEQAHSVTMMAHAMDCVSSAIKHINPGQTPVLVADQPLYALCRSIQCLKPETYGDNNYFIMMGSLHIEMAILRALGTILENSGWTGALVHSKVTTTGRAESMLRASHVTRTRYVHEVTVAVLYYLQQTAYQSHIENNAEDEPLSISYEEWYQEQCKTVPQFKYWDLVLRLELTMLQLIASLRSANFKMYKHALANIVGWFFALDQVNYARWLPVHISDLENLETKHPDLAQKFRAGCFVAKKSQRPFSAIGLDQNHEQVNATLKGNGGMIGLTERPDSLTKLLLTIPELASTISKFESANFEPSDDDSVHHSDSRAFIQLFQRDYESLKKTFLLWGNPFSEDGPELYNIETNVKAPVTSAETLQIIEGLGKSQYDTFVRERLESAQKLVTDPIPQNKISIWREKARTSVQKDAAKIRTLKSDNELFRKLFIVCQTRQYDMDEFFQYENQPWPPSLSANGQIRCNGKSEIMKCLITPVENSVHVHGTPLPAFEAKVFDGPAIVHMLAPGSVRTFQEYADKVFCTYIARECTPSVKRVDVVWDTYSDKSIKNATREKRGQGDRLVVNPGTKILKSWPNFLRDSNNKEQLFHLLAKSLQSLNVPGVDIYSTIDTNAICSSSLADLSFISPCNHEEADTRMLLHVADAARNGLQTCMVRASDSDVFVLAVAYAKKISNLQALWVSTGVGKHHKLVNATVVSEFLGPEKSETLPVVHAFSGCDTTSSFSSKGKKSVLDALTAFPEATQGFLTLCCGEVDESLPVLERFVVTMYDRSSRKTKVNDCRRDLFTKKARSPEYLPPSQDALRQHCLRACYQGGLVWGQCLVAQQDLPDPSLWGWLWASDGPLYWIPMWTTLGQIQKCLLVLMKCGCKNGCIPARCGCWKALLPCTELCECNGDCRQEQ